MIFYYWDRFHITLGFGFKDLFGVILIEIFFLPFVVITCLMLQKINLKHLKWLVIAISPISIFLFLVGVNWQIDLFNGYCEKTDSFLSSNEKIEMVIKAEFSSLEIEYYLLNLEACCSYTPPLKHWLGIGEDMALRYRLNGVYNGHVIVNSPKKQERTFFINNCGEVVNQEFLSSPDYM